MRAHEEYLEFILDVLYSLEDNVAVWMYPGEFAHAANLILYNAEDVHLDPIAIYKMLRLMKFAAPDRPLAPPVRKFIGAMLFESNIPFPPEHLKEFLPEFIEAFIAYHGHKEDTAQIAEQIQTEANLYYLGKARALEKWGVSLEKVKMYDKIMEALSRANPLVFIDSRMFGIEKFEERSQIAEKAQQLYLQEKIQ